eukprot:GILJ01008809.1.p1 GENE.GILJ01008809.1~~GILJ01008809.1.p1  ORF type:complete len:665 (-),score=90.11 GILJ01008809.1:106-2073(-)
MASIFVACVLLVFLTCFLGTTADPLDEKMYLSFADKPCIENLSRNGKIGCQSVDASISGPIVVLSSLDDLTLAEIHKPTEPSIWAINSTIISKTVLNRVIAIGQTAGIVLLNYGAPTSGFSPSSTSPQSDFGLHPSTPYTWNPQGADPSILSSAYPFPVISIAAADADALLTRLNGKLSTDYPRQVVEMRYDMFGVSNGSVCLLGQTCDPVGGQSVWGSFDPVSPSKPTVLLSVPLDSTALFHDLAIGAQAEMAGVAALLAVAETFSRQPRETIGALSSQIIFAFFNAEAWGFSGSRRFVSDMVNFTCSQASSSVPDSCANPPIYSTAFKNISFDQIKAIIELRNVGQLDDSGALYMHCEDSEECHTLRAKLLSYSALGPVPLHKASGHNGLPPSSLTSFLRQNSSLPAIQISNHNGAFINKFYHSEWDDASNVDVTKICDISTALARWVWSLASTDPIPSLSADCNLIKKLMNCLVADMGCDLFAQAVGYTAAANPSHYVGVWRPVAVGDFSSRQSLQSAIFNSGSDTANLVFSLLANYTAVTRQSANGCSNCEKNEVCIGNSQCVNSNTFFHDALSPSIKFDFDKLTYVVDDDPSQPLYTESRWGTSIGSRMFLQEDPSTVQAVFASGLAVFFVCAAVGVTVYWRFGKHLKQF